MDLMTFMMTVFALAVKYRLSVTSWIRSIKRNTLVGGKPNSSHCVGLAVDVVLDYEEVKESFIAEATKRGIRVIDEGDHLHMEPIK